MKFHCRILHVLALGLYAAASLQAANDWNRFRGPNGTGLAPDTGLPVAVDETTTLWKVPVDKGWSSPVLWGDFLVITAETGENKRAVIADAAKDGRELWRHEEAFEPHKLHKGYNSFASSSAFIDDQRIYIPTPAMCTRPPWCGTWLAAKRRSSAPTAAAASSAST